MLFNGFNRRHIIVIARVTFILINYSHGIGIYYRLRYGPKYVERAHCKFIARYSSYNIHNFHTVLIVHKQYYKKKKSREKGQTSDSIGFVESFSL